MKASNALSMMSLALFCAGTAWAQDPVKVDPTHYQVVLENSSVRVLKIDYAPGSKSTMHQHPDSIVIPLAASKVRFSTPDGKAQEMDLPSDSAMYTPAGTHSPANIGTGPVDAILVEFKAPNPGTASLPGSREGMDVKLLAEGPRATGYRVIAAPTFEEPAGSKHDYDQVVIALAPSQMALSLDGKAAKTNWARGDVQFIGRGVAHASKNMSGKPIEYVIVSIK
jgi:quercetin dioxygenase-like cupin family protein